PEQGVAGRVGGVRQMGDNLAHLRHVGAGGGDGPPGPHHPRPRHPLPCARDLLRRFDAADTAPQHPFLATSHAVPCYSVAVSEGANTFLNPVMTSSILAVSGTSVVER